MEITFDPLKRDRALAERGLDSVDAALVFVGPILQFQDERQDYGELRLVTVGFLAGRMVIIVWPRVARTVTSFR